MMNEQSRINEIEQAIDAIVEGARQRAANTPPSFWRQLLRRPVPATFTDGERMAILAHRMCLFDERMREHRRKQGHIVYRKGVSISPSATPACPPNCEHIRNGEVVTTNS